MEPPANFGDVVGNDNEYVKFYHAKRGYMTKFTFERIMDELSIPYVENKRRINGEPPDEPAVLIVDGHNSRYNSRMLRKLAEHHIDLFIIPAHSSHRMQPLDLTLNKLIKDHYRTKFPLCLSQVISNLKERLETTTTTSCTATAVTSSSVEMTTNASTSVAKRKGKVCSPASKRRDKKKGSTAKSSQKAPAKPKKGTCF